MASIRKRPRSDGTTAHQVLFKLGGTGEQQSETFDSEQAAKKFRGLVDAAGQQWPPGWVKGQGFAPAGDRGELVLFADWAEDYVAHLTGITGRTRDDYRRLVRNHLLETFGSVDVRDTTNFTPRLVAAWVNAMEAKTTSTEQPISPKTIANVHGLLYAIMQAAVEHEPPLRAANPCARTRLPRVDDSVDEEMVFLTNQEFDQLRRALTALDPDAADLATLLVGTGLRWGEVAALKVSDLDLLAAQPTLTVRRAWKRNARGERYLGAPKSKASRRTLRLSPALVDLLLRHVAGKRRDEFVFTGPDGGAWKYTTFQGRRWGPAVRAAMAGGLEKRPRIHDLRHTHVAWLIAAGVELPRIQRRLGHESITTTIDRYGHLLPEGDDRVSAAVDAALHPPPASRPSPVLQQRDVGRVPVDPGDGPPRETDTDLEHLPQRR